MDLPNQLIDYANLPIWINFAVFPTENGRLEKVPINPHTLGNGSSTKKESRSTFDIANNNLGKVACFFYKNQRITKPITNIGVCLGDGLLGIDLDNVVRRNSDGSLYATDSARDIFLTVNSYCERSVSGKGIHILVNGINPNPELDSMGLPRGLKIRRPDDTEFEIYCHSRAFCFSGNPLKNSPGITSNQDGINTIFEKYFKPVQELRNSEKRDFSSTVYKHNPSSSFIKNSSAIWEKMFTSNKGAEIRALYSGDLSAYNNDHSAADMALMSHLAYWTNNNEELMDQMFQESDLMRPKAMRNDYRLSMITKACTNNIPKILYKYSNEDRRKYATDMAFKALMKNL